MGVGGGEGGREGGRGDGGEGRGEQLLHSASQNADSVFIFAMDFVRISKAYLFSTMLLCLMSAVHTLPQLEPH